MKIKTCIFPVAGLGTRFLPATKSIPKEMLVIIDKPLIQYAVEEAKAAGIERFIFITSPGKTAIKEYFSPNERLLNELKKRNDSQSIARIKLAYLKPSQMVFIEQAKPLGLGHAILKAKKHIPEENFAVILPDDLIAAKMPCLQQMVDMHRDSHGNMVAAMRVSLEQAHHYGVLMAGQISAKKILVESVLEKPAPGESPSDLAIVGRYLLHKDIFNHLKKAKPGANGEIQLTDALADMIPESGLTGYLFDGTRFDCGMKDGWITANMAYACADVKLRKMLKQTMENL